MNGSNSFTDDKGREWLLILTPQAVRRVKEHCGIDVDKLVDVGRRQPCDSLLRLVDDQWKLTKVVYSIIHMDARQYNLRLGDFTASCTGPVAIEARDAFCWALYEYLDEARRPALKAACELVQS